LDQGKKRKGIDTEYEKGAMAVEGVEPKKGDDQILKGSVLKGSGEKWGCEKNQKRKTKDLNKT